MPPLLHRHRAACQLLAALPQQQQQHSPSCQAVIVFVAMTVLAAVGSVDGSNTLPAGCTMDGTVLRDCHAWTGGSSLDLSHLSISAINATAFTGLTTITSLTLSNNPITTLPVGLFQPLAPKLTELYLSFIVGLCSCCHPTVTQQAPTKPSPPCHHPHTNRRLPLYQLASLVA